MPRVAAAPRTPSFASAACGRSTRTPLMLALGVLVAFLVASPALALPALFDFGNGPVQDGWAGVDQSTRTGTSEGIQLTLDPVGSQVANPLGNRDRGGANGGGDENDMWRDFFFTGIDQAEGGSSTPLDQRGFDITLEGLVADEVYDVTFWAWDVLSSGGAGRFGQVNGGEIYRFASGDTAPETLDDLALTVQITADATGSALIEIRSSSSPIVVAPFLNGMRVDLSVIPEPSTTLLLGLGLGALGLHRRPSPSADQNSTRSASRA